MKTALIIIGGIAFLACAYYYNKRKHAMDNSPQQAGNITPEQAVDMVFDELIKTSAPEEIDQLSMDDVVAYFKGLKLQSGVDLPIVAQTIRDNHKIYMLVTFNEKTNELENYKLIVPKSVTEDLLTAIGQEKLITVC